MGTPYRMQRQRGGYVGALTLVHSNPKARNEAREALREATQVVGIPGQWEELEHPAAGGAFVVVGRKKVQSTGELPTVDEIVEAIRAAGRPRRSTE